MNIRKAAGCIIIKEGKIALLHRKSRNWYELPGGKVEEGETEETAAVREIREELLCDVQIIKKIGSDYCSTKKGEVVYTWFLAETTDEPQVGEPDIFDELKYFSFEDMTKAPMSTNIENILKRKEELNKVLFN